MNPVTDNGTIKAGSTHAQYTKDMAIKTVVNHACKYVINTSDDGSLVHDAALRSYDETTSRKFRKRRICQTFNGNKGYWKREQRKLLYNRGRKHKANAGLWAAV